MKMKINKFLITALMLLISAYSFSDNETPAETETTVNNTETKIENSEEATEPIVKPVTTSVTTKESKKAKSSATFKKKEVANILWRLTKISDKDLASSEDEQEKKEIITLYFNKFDFLYNANDRTRNRVSEPFRKSFFNQCFRKYTYFKSRKRFINIPKSSISTERSNKL